MKLLALILAVILAETVLGLGAYSIDERLFWAYVGGNVVFWGGLACLALSAYLFGGDA